MRQHDRTHPSRHVYNHLDVPCAAKPYNKKWFVLYCVLPVEVEGSSSSLLVTQSLMSNLQLYAVKRPTIRRGTEWTKGVSAVTDVQRVDAGIRPAGH